MAQPTAIQSIEETTPSTTSRRWMLILVTAAVACYWSSLYLYVPTLPVYAQEKTRDLEAVGVILSMYGLWQAILRLPLGIAADWLGRRKPFILMGFLFSALGAYLMATANGAGGLTLGRAVTGLAAASWVPLTVLYSSLFPPEEAVRATGLLMLINQISRMISTGITGSLNNLGGYSLAFLLAAGVAGLAILIMLPVREVAREPKRPSPGSIGRLVTRHDVLFPALLATVGQYITWATIFGFLPILAKNFGASGEVQSLLVSVSLGLSMVGSLMTSTLARRVRNIHMVYASYAILVAGIGLAAASASLPVLCAAYLLLGLGGGISTPLCMGMSIEKVQETERATAMGLHQAVYAIGMFAGPWLSGILAKQMGIQPMFGITAAACLALSLILGKMLEKR